MRGLSSLVVAVGVVLGATTGPLRADRGWSQMISTDCGLSDVWGSGPRDVFAVGSYNYSDPNDRCSVILHYDGTAIYNGTQWSWSSTVSGIPGILLAVWGSAPNDLFAVGYGSDPCTGDYGLIVHYDGSAWSSTPMMGTTNRLQDVWGSGPNDVFAVGQNGTILHYDGAGWSSVWADLNFILTGVWGSGPNDVFVCGQDRISSSGDCILHFDGETWQRQTTNCPPDFYLYGLYGIWGSGQNDVFAVGQGMYYGHPYSSNAVLHYDGSWSLAFFEEYDPNLPNLPNSFLFKIGGTGPSDVFAVGFWGDPYYLHYDGATWSWEQYGLVDAYGIWGSGPNDVFAVGATGDSPGKILHYQDQGQYALSITVVNGKSGQVRLDPSPSSDWSTTRYLADTLVTLTAEPAQGKKFCEWTLYDPDHPNDANYATLDGNSVITIRMNSDHGVQARFQCALGVGPMLPLMVAGLAGLMASRRRK